MATGKRPFFSWILIILVLLLGIGAVISGLMLFIAPNGDLMGMSTSLLRGSPFNDYFFPGIILFLFVGVFPITIGTGLLMTPWNPFHQYHWAWTGTLAAGLILIIWVTTETIMLGYISFLQPVMGIWGALLIILALLPGVRKFYFTGR
jgi:hypothetical protein